LPFELALRWCVLQGIPGTALPFFMPRCHPCPSLLCGVVGVSLLDDSRQAPPFA